MLFLAAFQFFLLFSAVERSCCTSSPSSLTWIVPGTQRVMPSATPKTLQSPAPPHTVSLARNEAESFQVVTRRVMNESVQVSVSGLPSNVAIEWHQVGFVKVDNIYANPQGGQGWWPDPLLPRKDGVAHLAANHTCSLWFDLRAGPNAPTGTFTVNVTLSPMTAGVPVVMVVKVRVFGFVLPKVLALKTAINLDETVLNTSYKFPTTSARHAMWMKFAKFLLTKFRLNPGTIYHAAAPFSVEEARQLVDLGMNHFTIARVPTTVAKAKEQIDELVDYVQDLRAANVSHLASVYGFDEADQSLAPIFSEVFGAYKARFPEVATVTTAHMQNSKGVPEQDPAKIQHWNVDHMCPVLDWINTNNMSSCIEAGFKMWYYTSCQPYLPYPNLRLDNPLLDARLLFWYASLLRVDGFLYWGFNAWSTYVTLEPIRLKGTTQDLFLDPAAWTLATCRKEPGSGSCWAAGLENLQGDGKLLYNGEDGAIASLRLAAVRDGLEDHEYLRMFKEVHGEKVAQDLIRHVIDTVPQNHTEDTILFEQLRLRIGSALEELDVEDQLIFT